MSESGAALAEVQRLRSTLHSLTSSAAPALPAVDNNAGELASKGRSRKGRRCRLMPLRE